MKNITDTNAERGKWRDDPCLFIETVLRNPEDGEPFKLYREQKTFLRNAFERTKAGKMRYSEQLFSAPKKSGKTGLAAMVGIFTAVVLAGNGGEIYCLANDREQAESRVYAAIVDILRASPLLRDAVNIGVHSITFKATGTTIKSVANDYAGFSGSNPTCTIYDETAYFCSEQSRRLWDEGIPSPARRISFRLSVSTAGFDGESSPLRDLYDRAMAKGEVLREPGILNRLRGSDLRRDGKFLCYWATTCKAPWQSKAWIEEQRATFESRPHQFARLIENQWTSAEDQFIPLQKWDACVDPSYSPIMSAPNLRIWVGLDASVSRDSSAVVAVTWDPTAKKVRLVRHRVFTPSKANPIDFENQIEAEIMDLRAKFRLQKVSFDPFQMISVSQRLAKRGVPMAEFTQTSGNLTAAGSALLELVTYENLVLYRDDEMRLAVSRCIAKDSARGWKITKAVASYKIDSVVALSFACLDAVNEGQQRGSGIIALMHLDKARAHVARGMPIADAAAAEGLGSDEVTRWIERTNPDGRASRLAAMTGRVPEAVAHIWEHARKFMDGGMSAEAAIAETLKLYPGAELSPDALAAYVARANAAITPPPRRFVQPPDAPLDPSKPRWNPWMGTPEK